MTETQHEILHLLNIAIDEFNREEKYLIKNDLSERCICSKFGTYIEKALIGTRFAEYIVDVEYNRGGSGQDYAAKKLNGRNIVVDLVVHQREYDQMIGFNNLFCIEMKKQYKNFNLSKDMDRLEMMTNKVCGFCYQAGFMILIVANHKQDEYKLKIDKMELYHGA